MSKDETDPPTIVTSRTATRAPRTVANRCGVGPPANAGAQPSHEEQASKE